MTEAIYHVTTWEAWRAAERAGCYEGSSDDRRDGFIHFSARGQLAESVAKHRAGQAGLVLLTVDPAALGESLKWEPSRGGALFPHLYGPLATAAVLRADDLPLGADGRHRFPEPGA